MRALHARVEDGDHGAGAIEAVGPCEVPSTKGTLSASCGSRRRSSAMTSTENAASSSARASGPTSSARSGTVSNSRRTVCRLPRSRVFTWDWTVATS